MTDAPDRLRVDKWLWHARFFKTRALAARTVADGKVRLDGVTVGKPSRTVTPGDVLTFVQAKSVLVVRVLAIGTRRGPAPEAQTLYEEISRSDPAPRDPAAQGRNPAFDKGGRPTKRDRRKMAQGVPRDLE